MMMIIRIVMKEPLMHSVTEEDTLLVCRLLEVFIF